MTKTYPGAGASPAAIAPRQSTPRPKALTAALLSAAGAVLLAAVAAVMVLAGGREALVPVVEDIAGEQLVGFDLAQDGLMEIVLDEAYQVYSGRAYMFLFFAAIGLIFLLTALKAKTWARVLMTLVLLGGIGLGALNALDVGTASHLALSALVAITSLIALVAFWLPSVGRYAKGQRART